MYKFEFKETNSFCEISLLLIVLMHVDMNNVSYASWNYLQSSSLPQYANVDELEADFMTLCKNAQIYNEDQSWIYWTRSCSKRCSRIRGRGWSRSCGGRRGRGR